MLSRLLLNRLSVNNTQSIRRLHNTSNKLSSTLSSNEQQQFNNTLHQHNKNSNLLQLHIVGSLLGSVVLYKTVIQPEW